MLPTHPTQGLNALKARGNGRISFRDLLGLHGLWKDYASRLVSQCGKGSGPGSKLKLMQQRVLAADLQVRPSGGRMWTDLVDVSM